MRRTLLNIAAVASALLAITLCVLWVRSYRNNRHGDQLGFSIGERPFEVRSQGGGLTLFKLEKWFFSGPSTGGNMVSRYNSHYVFGIAYWVVLPATAAFPAIWLIGRTRLRGRVAKGLCLRCGYDLRASPGRCPECGSAIVEGGATAGPAM